MEGKETSHLSPNLYFSLFSHTLPPPSHPLPIDLGQKGAAIASLLFPVCYGTTRRPARHRLSILARAIETASQSTPYLSVYAAGQQRLSIYCSLQVLQCRSNLNNILPYTGGEKTGAPTTQYLPTSYSCQTPTLLQIHIKGSKTKSRKEKKEKKKREKKKKKTERVVPAAYSHTSHTSIRSLTLPVFHLLTHSCPCPPRLRVSIILDNRSPPHPARFLLLLLACFSPLSESQVRLFLQFFSCHQGNLFTRLESRHNYTLPYPPFACP